MNQKHDVEKARYWQTVRRLFGMLPGAACQRDTSVAVTADW